MDTQRMQRMIDASRASAPLARSILVGMLLVAACGGPGEPPPEMVPVPAGPFVMGCDSGGVDPYCSGSEQPQHTVTLSAYEIDRLETTQAEFQACIDAAACVRPISDWDPDLRPDYPVRFVPWMVADAYCRWLGKRLPTEAEWEKAARGTDERIYPWGNELPDCEKVRFLFCPDEKTDPVGSHPAGVSPYGAQDMAGNVSEWASDWYELTYYQTSPDTDPQGPAAGTYKIVRGGDYLSEYYLLRAADRQVDNRTTGVGIRCARTI